MMGVALILRERREGTVSCVAMATTVQWTRVMLRCATNGELQMLLLWGLEGCDWRRSCHLRDEVKPPLFFLLVPPTARGGGFGISVMYSGDCAVKGRNSSSVAFQKSVLLFACMRHAINYVR